MKRIALVCLMLAASWSAGVVSAQSTPLVAGPALDGSIAAGWSHSLALRSNGTAVAWGLNNFGQRTVAAPNTNFLFIAGGGQHSLALRAGGVVAAWGRGAEGQTNVPAPNTNYIALAGGGLHSVGLKRDGSVVAWGLNSSGQTNVPTPNTNFIAIAAGWNHSLALRANGTVAAWGSDNYGQVAVPSPNTNFIAVAAGGYHSLGLKAGGVIVAWGRNTDGQTNVPAPNANFVAVSGGISHSVGLKTDGTVIAWGNNDFGQCDVPTNLFDVIAVAANGYHTLAMKTDGSIVAWGRNTDGQTNVPAPNASFGRRGAVVAPSRGSVTGGYSVAISGQFLPGDVTNVTLAGWTAAIAGQSATQVVVTAAAAPAPVLGDVVVASASAGSFVVADGFRYAGEQSIDFPAIADQTAAQGVGLAATASSGLPVSFRVAAGPASIAGGTNLVFSGSGLVTVVAEQDGNAEWFAAAAVTNSFMVEKTVAPLELIGLNQVYDGTPRVVQAVTAPTGLVVTITYDGGINPPVDAGTYSVTGIVQDTLYQAEVTGTLIVAVSPVAIVLGDTNQTYDGVGKTVSVATIPEGYEVAVTYNGQSGGPTNGGTYVVVAVVINATNFGGSVTGELTIARADQTITFGEIPDQDITNKVGLAAAATSGLPVSFGVLSGPAVITDGTNLSFTGTGLVGVSASQEGDINWNPAGGVFVFFTVYGEAPATTSNGVPISWLVGYGITSNYEQAVWEDPDGDGVVTGDEYVSDTIPTNGLSYLAIDQMRLPGGQLILIVPVSTARRYTVEQSATLINPTWNPVPGLIDIAPATTTLTITNSSPSAFHRIRVSP